MAHIRVLIVDDHPVIRQGLQCFLSQAHDMDVIGETGNAQEALRMARELAPAVVLLDMELEGLGGLQVAQTLQQEGSRGRVLGLSAHNDQCYVQELLKSGAAGYLCKDEMPDLILAAVRGVARGERGWISRHLVAQFATWHYAPSPSQSDLTRRETEILNQVMAGKTNNQIGALLAISANTVEKHLEVIFHKLKVSTRTEAAVWATRKALQETQISMA